jgi:hypothetical protein
MSKELEKSEEKHPALIDNDAVRERITTLFDGKVGEPYSAQKLEEICQGGGKRYQRKMPPGYLDSVKGGTDQYGDLIIWFQLIDKAKESKKPLIFITDDKKEDWWCRFKGKTVGPRPELIAEMVKEAEVSFYMYQSDQFMEYAQKYLKRSQNKEAIDEVRSIRREDEKHLRLPPTNSLLERMISAQLEESSRAVTAARNILAQEVATYEQFLKSGPKIPDPVNMLAYEHFLKASQPTETDVQGPAGSKAANDEQSKNQLDSDSGKEGEQNK